MVMTNNRRLIEQKLIKYKKTEKPVSQAPFWIVLSAFLLIVLIIL